MDNGFAEQLARFRPAHTHLVCIDSDGCTFDTMGIKQRECFCPWMIAHFGLQPVAEAARACKVFADLFSKTRGANRHVTIKRILTELLPSHPQVRARGFAVPRYPHYLSWVDDPGSLLSNDGLKRAIADAQDPEAKREFEAVLVWSERVNWVIGEIVKGIPPFHGVREALERLSGTADVIVVSATPLEALRREWAEHGIDRYAALICGQEMGTKAQQIAAVRGGYAADRILMIGDAPGDRRAATSNGVAFYPIVPGEEEDAWRRFVDEAIDEFLAGTYRGEYEEALLERFDRALPEHPPWEVRR
jgi:phosphoglycolate phosphatase-like HAD superfamily hydrolase